MVIIRPIGHTSAVKAMGPQGCYVSDVVHKFPGVRRYGSGMARTQNVPAGHYIAQSTCAPSI